MDTKQYNDFKKYLKMLKELTNEKNKFKPSCSSVPFTIFNSVPDETVAEFLSGYKTYLVSEKDIKSQFCYWYLDTKDNSYGTVEKHRLIGEWFSNHLNKE